MGYRCLSRTWRPAVRRAAWLRPREILLLVVEQRDEIPIGIRSPGCSLLRASSWPGFSGCTKARRAHPRHRDFRFSRRRPRRRRWCRRTRWSLFPLPGNGPRIDIMERQRHFDTVHRPPCGVVKRRGKGDHVHECRRHSECAFAIGHFHGAAPHGLVGEDARQETERARGGVGGPIRGMDAAGRVGELALERGGEGRLVHVRVRQHEPAVVQVRADQKRNGP